MNQRVDPGLHDGRIREYDLALNLKGSRPHVRLSIPQKASCLSETSIFPRRFTVGGGVGGGLTRCVLALVSCKLQLPPNPHMTCRTNDSTWVQILSRRQLRSGYFRFSTKMPTYSCFECVDWVLVVLGIGEARVRYGAARV